MNGPDVSPLLAFAAGLLSFVSPCVLPLVPAYLGYLGGQAAGEETGPRWRLFLHGLFFVLGFAIVFVALGAVASGIGQLLAAHRLALMRIGGLIIVIFGLHTLGALKIPLLHRDTRRHTRPPAEMGYLSSVLMGVFFGAGWSPCIGPTLGAILTLALNEGTVGRGALLLLIYSSGLGLPFLLMALGVDRAAAAMLRTGKLIKTVKIVSGLFLIILGALVFTNQLGRLAQWGPWFDLDI